MQNTRPTDRILRAAMMVLVIATCIRIWLGPPTLNTPAMAQVPDAGRQRHVILQEAQRTNDLLEEILVQLRQGVIKVRPADSDKNGAADAAKPSRGATRRARP